MSEGKSAQKRLELIYGASLYHRELTRVTAVRLGVTEVL
jgi:hypothetical protein